MHRGSSLAGGLRAALGAHTTTLAFLLMVLFSGSNTVVVRFSSVGLPPFWGAAIRCGAAALVFWLFVAVRRIALPKGRAMAATLFYGLLAVGAAYAFLYWGLLRIPASLTGAIMAPVPLLTLGCAWLHKLEQLRGQAVIGAVVATLGVTVGVMGGVSGDLHIPSLLAVVAGTICLAEASVLFKLLPPIHPAATNALALSIGTPLLLLLSLIRGEQWNLPATANTWAAFAYLVLIGSVVVFYLYLHVLARWTASKTAYSFLLMPVVTVFVASWLTGELISTRFIIGGVLVLAGVWLGAIKSSPRTVEILCTPTASQATC